MDFGIPQELQKTLSTIQEFLEQEVYPLEKHFLGKSFRSMLPQLQEKRKTVQDAGLWLPQMSKKLGGMGLSLLDFAHISEKLGQSPIGHYLFNCQAPDAGNMEILHQYGTSEQQKNFLEPLLAGKTRSCFSMTEPDNPGSNPTWMTTSAITKGEDYQIDGHKWFTTAADGASFAIVMAVTNPDAQRYGQASMIIVPTDTPGFELKRNISVMGDVGDDYATHAEILYENCTVPKTNLLGQEGAGFVIAQERLGPGRIHHCMRWIGICERSLSLMCERAATRMIRPGKPLGTKQTIQNWIAESRAEIDAARLMVLRTAWQIDSEGIYAARESISLIKFYVAGVLQKVLDRAIQTHGALGMTDDTPIAYWFRHERGARIYDGPDEVHKSVVARRMLRSYGTSIS